MYTVVASCTVYSVHCSGCMYTVCPHVQVIVYTVRTHLQIIVYSVHCTCCGFLNTVRPHVQLIVNTVHTKYLHIMYIVHIRSECTDYKNGANNPNQTDQTSNQTTSQQNKVKFLCHFHKYVDFYIFFLIDNKRSVYYFNSGVIHL